jgi:hypothetical protein
VNKWHIFSLDAILRANGNQLDEVNHLGIFVELVDGGQLIHPFLDDLRQRGQWHKLTA